jgi:hypothetical protein
MTPPTIGPTDDVDLDAAGAAVLVGVLMLVLVLVLVLLKSGCPRVKANQVPFPIFATSEMQQTLLSK